MRLSRCAQSLSTGVKLCAGDATQQHDVSLFPMMLKVMQQIYKAFGRIQIALHLNSRGMLRRSVLDSTRPYTSTCLLLV